MSIELPIYQVDAFAERLFSGNPAAVIVLHQWLPDTVMGDIAAENNLAETAFIIPDGDGFALRWFTPTVEVPLCGHATLAAGFVVLDLLQPGRKQVPFSTRRAGPSPLRARIRDFASICQPIAPTRSARRRTLPPPSVPSRA